MISTNRVYKPAQKGLESARVLEGKESTHTERAGARRDGGRGKGTTVSSLFVECVYNNLSNLQVGVARYK